MGGCWAGSFNRLEKISEVKDGEKEIPEGKLGLGSAEPALHSSLFKMTNIMPQLTITVFSSWKIVAKSAVHNRLHHADALQNSWHPCSWYGTRPCSIYILWYVIYPDIFVHFNFLNIFLFGPFLKYLLLYIVSILCQVFFFFWLRGM